MAQAAPEGFVPDPPKPAVPDGFVPDAPKPYFHVDVKAPDWLDRLTEWLPAIGGTVGGVAGGIGGTVLGVGVGGPPGAIMGAALGGAAGEAYKHLMKRARGRVDVPSTGLDAAESIGKAGAIQGATQAAGEVLAPAAQFIGRRMMQSSLKPGLKVLVAGVKAGDRTPKVVQTLLDEGVNVTPGGVAKLQGLLDATKADVAATINRAGPQTINPLRAASRLSPTAQRFATQVNPQADLEAISQVGQNFLEAHPNPLSLTEAQALKQGTYARIGGKYGKESIASIEAEKAVARGLKEELEAAAPGIGNLNAREAKLLEALHVTGKRVALSGNKDPIGFAWVAHNPTTFLAALMDRSPAVKSMIARGLYTNAGKIAKVSPVLVRIAVQSVVSGEPADVNSTGR